MPLLTLLLAVDWSQADRNIARILGSISVFFTLFILLSSILLPLCRSHQRLLVLCLSISNLFVSIGFIIQSIGDYSFCIADSLISLYFTMSYYCWNGCISVYIYHFLSLPLDDVDFSYNQYAQTTMQKVAQSTNNHNNHQHPHDGHPNASPSSSPSPSLNGISVPPHQNLMHSAIVEFGEPLTPIIQQENSNSRHHIHNHNTHQSHHHHHGHPSSNAISIIVGQSASPTVPLPSPSPSEISSQLLFDGLLRIPLNSNSSPSSSASPSTPGTPPLVPITRPLSLSLPFLLSNNPFLSSLPATSPSPPQSNPYQKAHRLIPYFHLICWVYPLITCCIIASMNDSLMVQRDPWCLVTNDIAMSFSIYFPLFFSYFLCVVFYFLNRKILRNLDEEMSTLPMHKAEIQWEVTDTRSKLIYIPLIFIIFKSFEVTFRIFVVSGLLSMARQEWLSTATTIANPSIGIVYSILFVFLTKRVRAKMGEKIRKRKGDKAKDRKNKRKSKGKGNNNHNNNNHNNNNNKGVTGGNKFLKFGLFSKSHPHPQNTPPLGPLHPSSNNIVIHHPHHHHHHHHLHDGKEESWNSDSNSLSRSVQEDDGLEHHQCGIGNDEDGEDGTHHDGNGNGSSNDDDDFDVQENDFDTSHSYSDSLLATDGEQFQDLSIDSYAKFKKLADGN